MADNNDDHSDSGENELSGILKRRQSMNEAMANGEDVEHKMVNVKTHNVYVHFQEFSRKEIKDFEKKFKA